MRSLLALTGTVLIAFGVLGPVVVVATPSMLGAFTAEYPFTAGGKLDDCLTCHQTGSGGPLNPYGSEYSSSNFAFGAIENKDSDDDGFTNIDEITAGTFPGDAGDFPSGGGDDRVTGRGTLASGVDALMAAAVTDTATGKVMAAWTQQGAALAAGADVFARLALATGSETGKVVDLGDAVTGEHISIGSGQKVFLAAWDGEDGVLGRIVKGNGKAQKGPNVIAEGTAGPAVGYDDDLKLFLVASAADDGVLVNQVDKKGQVVARLSSGAPESIPELGRALGFAAGMSDSGYVLFGTEVKGKKARPRGAQLVEGVAENVASGYGSLSKKEVQAAGAFASGSSGLVIWRNATAVAGAGLAADGSLSTSVVKYGGVSAGQVAVAVQPDGNFLAVWTDTKTGKLLGIDLNDAGRTLGDPFELQDTGEVVDGLVLAAVSVKDGVLVVYATSGAAGDVRTAVVGPQ